jgi:hypothetical protein
VAKYPRAVAWLWLLREAATPLTTEFFFFFYTRDLLSSSENPHEEMPARDQVRTAFRSLRSLAFLLTPFATISLALALPTE